MTIRRPTLGKRIRGDLQTQLDANSYQVDEPANGAIALPLILQARNDLLDGRRGIIQSVDAATAAHLLGDRDAALGYAETLAAEAAARRASGDEGGAHTMEERAIGIAMAIPNPGNRDAELGEFIAALKRRQMAVSMRPQS